LTFFVRVSWLRGQRGQDRNRTLTRPRLPLLLLHILMDGASPFPPSLVLALFVPPIVQLAVTPIVAKHHHSRNAGYLPNELTRRLDLRVGRLLEHREEPGHVMDR
jgi:hypothetical protein